MLDSGSREDEVFEDVIEWIGMNIVNKEFAGRRGDKEAVTE